MSDAAPFTLTLAAALDASGAKVTTTIPVGDAPFAGTVSSVTYTAAAAVTGADTDTRTLTLVNKGQDGSGSTTVATLALKNGVNLAAFDEKALTLSGTAGNLAVAAGDVLAFASTYGGTNGLADPGGEVQITLSRS
jgi:hypothetical protein